MDNMDTCCLEDQKKMDSNKVWQWRIMCGKEQPVRLEPFHHSNRIGLDFNPASNTHTKIDLKLVTNGVILEVCDFAKTVNKSKGHFITNILENNFDLGLENEKRLTDFTAQILHKVKHLIKKPPKDKKEIFTLFDTSSKPECKTNNGLNIASAEQKTERFMVEMDDTDDGGHGDEYTCSQAASKEYIKTESLLEDMEGADGDDRDDEDEFKDSGALSAEELMEDVLLPKFPYCEEICLNLDVGSKQSLDPGLLTKGVMLELVHFTKILTVSFRLIVLGVLKHNFELDLKSQQGKNQIWFRILHLLKRRDGLITTGSEISMEFKNEPFSFQTNSFKESRGSALSNMEVQQNPFPEVTKRRRSGLQSKREKMALLAISERANKGHRRGKSKDMETNALSHHTELCTTRTAEGDHCQTGSISEFDLDSYTGNECDKEQKEIQMENYHTCPQGETVLDSDKVTNPGNQSHKSCSLSSGISRESEASCRNVCAPFLILTDISSSLPIVNANTKSMTCQPDERKLGRGKEQTQTLKNAPNKCDMEQEDLGTENMWKLRANRVKQILSAKEFGPFQKSKNFGLEFNVGFNPKQKFSVDSLTDSILLEIAKFAIAMNSSQQNFIMEILEYNFDISLESKYQRNIFTCEIMKRVRQLKDCEDAVKFSKEVFELHGPIPSISMANQSVASVNAELSSISRMEECDVACGFPPHSQAETKEHISQKCMDLYPFCKDISLKLNVNDTRPNKKLDINKLTYGAMTEVTNIAEKLCGTFEQICFDIVKHNLDLDSQCGDSDLARSIVARIPAVLEQRKLSSYVNSQKQIHKSRRYSSTNWQLDSQNNPNSDAARAGSSQAAIIDQDVNSSPDIKHQNESKLKLWQLRANHIQQILSIPHEEQCPLYSYSRCKKLGIDFNVGSRVKQNLDPKLLTNGIMVEIGTFATALLSAQKYFITEILEYNFHLYFDNELHRRAFAEKTLIKIKNKKLLNKNTFPSTIKTQFKLPDTRCRPEPTFERNLYCPKCCQVRINKHRRDESDSRHMNNPCPHTSVDANCSAQKPAKDPSSTFSEIEELIMDKYPRCKEVGLSLCVDKDQPKDKLDMHVLTSGTIGEVTSFAKRLCATKYSIFYDVLQHNFNIGMQGPDVNPAMQFHRGMKQSNGLLSWLNEVFVIQRLSNKQLGNVRKMKRAFAIHGSELKETIKKRKLALRTKEKMAKTYPLSKENRFPISTEISLTPGERKKLDLKQITKSVCDMDQEEMSPDNYYTCPLGESDLESDELTDLENSVNEDNLGIPKCSLSSDTSSIPTVNSNLNPWFASQPDERGLGGGEEQTQTLKNAPNKCDMEQEDLGTENMWKLRANRVKQILSAKEFGPFQKSKNFGLEFNVGFNPKQKFSVDSLTDSILLEIAKFAIAMNSSQQNFIMEILEYNFDISLESKYQRNIFTCEIMKRVRQLKDCEDAVKFSKEVFELHGPIPSISMANQSVASVNAELSSISRMEECDVACGFPPHSQAETKEHISQKSVDLHPFCKEIGLKLHVNNTQPNKKLNINTLTYGAMTEVTNIAEKLCGTFEQICVDILKHNIDLQCGDSDPVRSIVARIPVVIERKNLSLNYVTCHKKIMAMNNTSAIKIKLDSKNNPTSDAASAGSSQAAIIDQEVNSSPDIEGQSELNSKLWQLRENQIQQILSIPHEENCPLYSYSRCKKVGIDFNAGSGVKQNLDPKLLTNGIMVELHTFATALLSAQKYFITDILEYNFHLDLNNELYRSGFVQKTMKRIGTMNCTTKSRILRNKMQFHLPDTKCIPEPAHWRMLYCPKCYQVRNEKHRRDDSGSRHMHHPRPHTMTDANCSVQEPAKDPSSTFSAIEEMIMDNYPFCKEIGLSLCVDKDQPKDKLDMHVLTHGVMKEVAHYAKKMCGTKYKIINDVLQHNFNIDMQCQEISTVLPLQKVMRQNDVWLAWLSEVFDIQPYPRKLPDHGSQFRETIKKRKMALQTQKKTAKTNPPSKGNRFPISTKNCLKSGEEEKLNLKLIKQSMGDMEQEEMAADNYHNCPLGEFDLDSDELSDSENFVNQVDHLQNPKSCFLSSDIAGQSEASCRNVCAPFLILTDISSSLPIVNTNTKLLTRQPGERGLGGGEEQTQTPKNAPTECDMEQEELGTENNIWKLRANRVKQILSAIPGSELKETIEKRKLALQTQERKVKKSPLHKGNRFPTSTEMSLTPVEKEKLDLKLITKSVCDMEQEEMAPDNYYTRPLGESDLDSDELTDLENSGNEDNLQIPKLSLSLVTSSLPTTVNSNLNLWFASQPDETGLGGDEEQIQTLKNAPTECDMEQEDLGTENNMWKLRANRVKQILSAKEFGPFGTFKRFGLKLNVGFGPKPNFSVRRFNSVLVDIAKFAIAMNSSLHNFIMEILEYNFDICLQSEYQRNIFTCEIMKRVRQLKDCEDAVKFSKEIFELHGPIPSISMANQSVASVNTELSSISRMEECDVACGSPPLSQAETEDQISQLCVDLHPFCNDISLKLHVNNTHPNKKLDINKLTYGAMTEVTNFAEKLCGTFEQICIDIVKHNLDLDSQCGDSDLARSIVARIPAVLEKGKLASFIKSHKYTKDFSWIPRKCPGVQELDSQNNPNSDAASAGSSQVAIIDQEVNSSPGIEHQNEFELKLWQLRANCIQKILSIPHDEQCPLYSYSRCKKLGIDFNVGSGVKQNLDPKLLTNGIMVEIGTFATALLSAQKYFITDILEYNFHLNFNNELYRHAFADKMKGRHATFLKKNVPQLKTQFELPDTWCRPAHFVERSLYCPKCYQVRNHMHLHYQDESDSRHMHHPCPHTMTDAGSADANCFAQKPAKDPSSTFSAIEEMIMDNYPLCKEIGLSLFVDKDQPKDKLESHVLTQWIMREVSSFAKRLSRTKYLSINDVLQHNFNIEMQGPDVNPARQFHREMKQSKCVLSWLNEVFVIQPLPISQPRIVCNMKPTEVEHGSEWMESIKRKQSEKKLHSQGCYPICTEMGLDLEVTSKSGEKEKLDLKRLTRAAVFEIYKFADSKKPRCYIPHAVYEILDYNFDISSQHHRSMEFSITTASRINNMFKAFQKYRNGPDKVFKLPFVFDRPDSRAIRQKAQKRKCTKNLSEVPGKKMNKGNFVRQARYQSDENRVHFVNGAKINKKTLFCNEDPEFPTDPGTIVQIHRGQVGAGCGDLLQGNLQIKEEEYDPRYQNIKPEPDTEKQCYPLTEDVKTESCTADAEHLVPGEPTALLGYSFLNLENENLQYLLAEPQRCDASTNTDGTIKTEWDTEGVKYLVPVEAAGSLGYSMVTIGQGNESTLIKKEQENVSS